MKSPFKRPQVCEGFPGCKCSTLTVNPGDIIVVSSPKRMTREQFHRIRDQIKAAIPEARAVVLEEGLSISVERLRDEDAAYEAAQEDDALRSILP